MMRTALISSILLPLTLLSSHAKETEPVEEQSALPAMKVLPIGSSLHKIRAPRFNENYETTSLFSADRVDILSPHKLKGTGVDLTLYKNNAPQASTHLKSVFFWESSDIIHSVENMTISGDSFDIAAQGLILHIEKHAGFLLGKTQTLFYPEKDQKMASSVINNKDSSSPAPATPMNKVKKAATVLVAIPSLLSADELKEIDALAAPSTALIQNVDAQAQADIHQIEETSSQVSQEQEALRSELSTAVDNDVVPVLAAEPLTPKKGQTPVTVTSDNGMYFDAISGTVVYSKNVVVTHPKYKLTCSDELKILLKEDPNAEKADPPKPGEAPTPDTKNLAKFDGLDKAIASGNVVIRSKDKKGNPVVIKAQIATYNGNTGVTILKGGRPTITQGNTIARVLSDSGYIKILPNMSTRIEGKHEIKANLKELQND